MGLENAQEGEAAEVEELGTEIGKTRSCWTSETIVEVVIFAIETWRQPMKWFSPFIGPEKYIISTKVNPGESETHLAT